jgi:hypothetical protein
VRPEAPHRAPVFPGGGLRSCGLPKGKSLKPFVGRSIAGAENQGKGGVCVCLIPLLVTQPRETGAIAMFLLGSKHLQAQPLPPSQHRAAAAPAVA